MGKKEYLKPAVLALDTMPNHILIGSKNKTKSNELDEEEEEFLEFLEGGGADGELIGGDQHWAW